MKKANQTIARTAALIMKRTAAQLPKNKKNRAYFKGGAEALKEVTTIERRSKNPQQIAAEINKAIDNIKDRRKHSKNYKTYGYYDVLCMAADFAD